MEKRLLAALSCGNKTKVLFVNCYRKVHFWNLTQPENKCFTLKTLKAKQICWLLMFKFPYLLHQHSQFRWVGPQLGQGILELCHVHGLWRHQRHLEATWEVLFLQKKALHYNIQTLLLKQLYCGCKGSENALQMLCFIDFGCLCLICRSLIECLINTWLAMNLPYCSL